MDKTRVEDPRPEQHKQSSTGGYTFRSLQLETFILHHAVGMATVSGVKAMLTAVHCSSSYSDCAELLFQYHQEMVPAVAAADKSAILWRMLKLILCFSFYKVITRPNSLLGKAFLESWTFQR